MPLLPELHTPRLLLNPFILSDATRVQSLAGVFEVADTTLNIPHPYPEGAAETWIASHPDAWARAAGLSLAIRLSTSGELIGTVGFSEYKQDHQAELGFWIGMPYRGHGYGTEAAAALVEYAFGKLGLQRVFARHLLRNPASGRVQQKIGMQPEGMLRQHVLKWGKPEDVVIYGLLREEWLAQQAARAIRS